MSPSSQSESEVNVDEQEEEEGDESSEEERYEVEKILDHCINLKKKEIKFQVKWKGYDKSEATWEDFVTFT